MKRIALFYLVLLVGLLSSCVKSDDEYLLESIDEKIVYLNGISAKIIVDSNQNEYFDKVSQLNYYDQQDNIELENDITIILIDSNFRIPEVNELEMLLDLYNNADEENFVSICFMGVSGFEFLEGYFLAEEQPKIEGVISLCFGNYEYATTEYQLSVDNTSFEDIPSNELHYTNLMLKYIQKQIIKYYSYVG